MFGSEGEIRARKRKSADMSKDEGHERLESLSAQRNTRIKQHRSPDERGVGMAESETMPMSGVLKTLNSRADSVSVSRDPPPIFDFQDLRAFLSEVIIENSGRAAGANTPVLGVSPADYSE